MTLRPHNNFFGLDISDGALRLMKVKRSRGVFALESFNSVSLPDGIIVQGEIEEEKELIHYIKKLIQETRGKKIYHRNVISVLPETKSYVKVINLPDSYSEARLLNEVKKELHDAIPLDIDDLYFDWHIAGRHEHSVEVLVGAAPQTIADAYCQVLEKSGLVPYALEIEAAAITRAISTIIRQKRQDATIIVDIGASRSSLMVYDHGSVQFTASLPFSGRSLDRLIAEMLDIHLAQAEKIKIIYGADPQHFDGELLKLTLPLLDSFLEHITGAIEFYERQFAHATPITEIVLTGGGAHLAYLDQLITKQLNIPVSVANPSAGIRMKKRLTIPENEHLSYTTALGLALRPHLTKSIV